MLARVMDDSNSLIDGSYVEAVSSKGRSAVWIRDGIGDRDLSVEVISWGVGPTIAVVTGDKASRDGKVIDR